MSDKQALAAYGGLFRRCRKSPRDRIVIMTLEEMLAVGRLFNHPPTPPSPSHIWIIFGREVRLA